MKTSVDRAHLTAGLVYGALGLGLGIYMAAGQNHVQQVTHAHLLLAGFLLSVIYAIVYRLWLPNPGRWLSGLQFALHHVGVVLMVSGLFLLYSGRFSHGQLEPVLAGSSILVLLALLMMLAMVIKVGRTSAAERIPPKSHGTAGAESV